MKLRQLPPGRLVLLAPEGAFIPRRFENIECDARRHEDLLAGIQRLRGRLYLQDGAIASRQVAADGRHQLAGDEGAWHVVTLDEQGRVAGCARYLAHPNSIAFHKLTVRNSALAHSAQWGDAFREAVAGDMQRAHRRGVAYAEVGGWALAPELRRTREALRIALATYGLARALGGCIGITTATLRHCSSTILRRIGGESLRANQMELPRYFDPQYGCEMEVLRFDSIQSAGRLEGWLSELTEQWVTAPVIRASSNRLPAMRTPALPSPARSRPSLWNLDLALA